MVGDALILAEHIANLARADADIASGHVNIGTDMAVELGHEALAEAHHFMIAFALGVEVRAALAAAHRQAGQRVLESLLEREELQDAFGNRGVEANAALIWPNRIVVLHAPAALHANILVIIFPAHAERDDPVRFGDPAQDLVVVIFLLVGNEFVDILRNFLHSLDKFGLTNIAFLDAFHKYGKIDVITDSHFLPPTGQGAALSRPLGMASNHSLLSSPARCIQKMTRLG